MSATKACVVYQKTSAKTKRTPSKVHKDGKLKDLEARMSIFKSVWKEVKEKAESIQLNSFMDVLTELTSYLKDKSKSYENNHHISEIPSAILITGVNIPDHEAVYEALKELIRKTVSELVVFVSSNEASTFKTLMQKLVGTLLKINDEMGDLPSNRCTMQVLKAWYADGYSETLPSPSKRSKVNDQRDFSTGKAIKPIVIVFEDFESFQSKGIEDFIQISRNYMDHLPIILVFCISTFGATLSESLSQTALSSLSINTFSSQNPMKQLSAVLEEIQLNRHFYYRLGSRVYKYLTDYFLFSDYSVKTFLSGFKMSMLSHYFLNPYSILCCDVALANDYIDSLQKSDIEELRELCFSNAKATEKLDKKELRALLQDDNYFKKHIARSLNDLHKYHSHFFTVLRFFHVFTKDLPNLPFGNQLHQLYFLCLDKEIGEYDEFKDFIKLIKLMSREELMARLTDGLNILKSDDCDNVETLELFESCLKELIEIADEKTQKTVELTHSYETGKKIDLNTLQKNLKEMGEAKKRKSPFERLRSNIANYLEEFLRQGLRNYRSFAFYEIYYFDNVKCLKQKFIGNFNSSIKLALVNPRSYIKCQCCLSDDGDDDEVDTSISSSYPDISIAYKLLSEGGGLVNLFDWLQSFVAVIDLKNSDNLSSKVRSKKTKRLIAQFTQSVEELQYLGLIKKTSRKTDHVARIFW